jgi:acetylornithine deacetylase/succinyl-diaminopimelate desuccinylase-like protein
MREQALKYAREHREQFLNDLKAIVSIPSISTDDAYKPDIQKAAEWVADQLRSFGMDKVQIFPTARHPVVYGEWLGAGTDKPTVLIYGHYDVQPVDPIELWATPPFEPTVRSDNLYGRGASDMKGQVVASLKAVEAVVRTGGLPVNIKWLIEGEEEIGSPSLPAFIAENKELLACDVCLNPDAGMIGADLPTITYALRGLAYFEIRIKGPDHDLHSGINGGVVRNPANELARLIAGMHDENNHITLPGFYDKVRELDAEERAELARLPLDDEFYLKQAGAPALWGEKGYSAVERTSARPTLDVNGLLSGWTGQGAKTVLPAAAMAKVSCRLVPDQDPEEIYQSLLKYMEINAPPTITWEVVKMTGGAASISDLNNFGVQAMSEAMESVWGRRPLFKREGGSVPVVGQMQSLLNVESVLIGFGLPDDNLHAPNEKQTLPVWYQGIETLVHFFYNL